MLPSEFSEYTSRIFGKERWEKYLRSFQEETPVSIRLNPFKADAKRLQIISEGAEEVPWCRNAWWLQSRPRFTSDPLFHAGAYYVQEAGSMFLDTVLKTYNFILLNRVPALAVNSLSDLLYNPIPS